MQDIRKLLRQSEANIDEFLRELQEKDRERNPYRFHPSVDRNIVLIGRTRTGKSTLVNVINDIFYVASAHELYSRTQKIEFQTISTDTQDGIWYYFNFIDVPGFFDIGLRVDEKLTNKSIASYLQDCMGKDITNIHMFAFVLNLAGGINERDLETMLFVKTQYPYLSKYMALVITHGEQLADGEKERLVREFLRHPTVIKNQFQAYFKLGVLFMGCLRHESVSRANDQSMYYEYNNILDMRKTFIDICISCAQPFNFYQGSALGVSQCSIS
jgi:GTP-binding protein EngB required for normal cell division